jgi:pimeloyl-ACP methyl ester carboxylesterase
MRRTISSCIALAACLTTFTACSESPTIPSRHLASGKARGDAAPTVWADRIEGTTANGAPYALFKPAQWNGDVIYYAHGFIDPELPTGLPVGDDAEAIRDALGANGFAVAYSGFSENGYDFADGLRRTHQLRGLFTSRYGKANRSFLLGHSIGAQIIQALAEQYPGQYDGAVALCGVLGGTRQQLNHVGNVRTMFDLLYPNWLPGTTTDNVPVVPTQQQVVGAALTALGSNNFQGLGIIASIDQSDIAGRNAPELTNSLLTALVYHARSVNDVLARSHGHLPFDNSNTIYTSSLVPSQLMAFINSSIARYTATADANAWLDNNWEPSGALRIPMLTLHNRYDPVVPFEHEATYATKTTAAGFGANLRQRSRDDYGHCTFGATLTASTVQDLVNWVTTGAPPAP